MKEVWKQCRGYPRIEVSSLGNVRCFKTKRPRYRRISKQGYWVIQYSVNNKAKCLKIHRLVAIEFLPPPTQELIDICSKSHHGIVCVNHIDCDKTNNIYTNLEWCDIPHNNKEAMENGLVPPLKGELNGRSVLTEDLVHRLCKAYEDGMMPKEAVEVFGISRQQATKIRAGFAWKHVSSQYDISVNKRSKKFND